MSNETAKYSTVTVEAAVSGWIVKEKGQPAKVFVRWEALVSYLQYRLATKDATS